MGVVLARLRQPLANPMHISTSFMGEEVENGLGSFTLSQVCCYSEVLRVVIDNSGKQVQQVVPEYLSDSSISNGQITFKKDDFLFIRKVSADDELLVGYESSLTEFRAKKAGLETAQTVPPPKPAKGAGKVVRGLRHG